MSLCNAFILRRKKDRSIIPHGQKGLWGFLWKEGNENNCNCYFLLSVCLRFAWPRFLETKLYVEITFYTRYCCIHDLSIVQHLKLTRNTCQTAFNLPFLWRQGMRSSVSHHGATTTMDAVSNSKNSRKEEDEDELESLRLAALESLRAKGLPPPIVLPVNNAGNSNPNQVLSFC